MPTLATSSPSGSRVFALLTALTALLLLPGCFTFDVLLTVRPDGSGLVEQIFVLQGPMLEMLRMFSEEDELALCREDELRQETSTMGEGVRLVSVELTDEDDTLGCRTVYSFDDINTLTLNLAPDSQLPASMEADETESNATPDFTFSFTPGSPASLVMNIPQSDEDDAVNDNPETAPVDSTTRAQQLNMMRRMLRGGRLSMAVELEGTVTESNATYLLDNVVTLLEIDFDRFLEDDVQLERLADANPTSPEEVRALLEEVEGIKVETLEEVFIRFK
ncbi:MAG: hypothetical protein ACE5G0_02620 [Rhodothermales bacterium]